MNSRTIKPLASRRIRRVLVLLAAALIASLAAIGLLDLPRGLSIFVVLGFWAVAARLDAAVGRPMRDRARLDERQRVVLDRAHQVAYQVMSVALLVALVPALLLDGVVWPASAVRTLPPYFAEEIYVETLAASIAEGVAALDFEPDVVVTSYHGMPQSYFERGDPYHDQCHETTRLVRERLGWPEERLLVTFQSRFGPTEWLQPYTDVTLKALPGQGRKKVAICAPAFSADCIETLEELAITGQEQFEHAGGERYAYIPCLNDGEPGMAMLEALVRNELQGWL